MRALAVTTGMSRYFSIRVGLVAAAMTLAASSWLAGQALKPSAAVSSLPAAQPTGANSAAEPDLRTKQVPQHLDVIYSDGKLAVDATNASLNEILLEVSKKTGIKVTGNVSDDRVFGHYGPSSPAMILDALLDGTENNFLLMGGWGDRPGGSAAGSSGNAAESGSMAGAELILTPRRGGASPPNPNASVASEDGELRERAVCAAGEAISTTGAEWEERRGSTHRRWDTESKRRWYRIERTEDAAADLRSIAADHAKTATVYRSCAASMNDAAESSFRSRVWR